MKDKRGGNRKGAGRPKTKEDTIVMRIPKSKVKEVKELITPPLVITGESAIFEYRKDR